METKKEKPDFFERFTHIDFCFRASEHLAPKSNHPKGLFGLSRKYFLQTAQQSGENDCLEIG